MRRILMILGAAAWFLLAGCAVALRHDPSRAGQRAAEFARMAFVNNNSAGAYALLSPRAKAGVSVDQFASAIAGMIAVEAPKTVSATSYEEIPDQALITIYVDGMNGKKQLHYKILLEGSRTADYGVVGYFRRSTPYPSLPGRKPLTGIPQTRNP